MMSSNNPVQGSPNGLRGLAKRLIAAFSFFAAFPFYLFYRINTLFLDKEAAIQGPSQLMSLWPGWLGNYLRKAFYVLSLRRCSPDCTISFGTIFSTPDCEIGRNVYIGAYCVISDSTIGDDTLIGSHVHLISGKHAHGFEASDVPIRFQKTSRSEIWIGGNSWIGNGAIVMANVGHGCVVGAGSIVTKEIPDDSVAVGNPAKVIKKRQKNTMPISASSGSESIY
jgi:virginiamycin A acetyltransferase